MKYLKKYQSDDFYSPEEVEKLWANLINWEMINDIKDMSLEYLDERYNLEIYVEYYLVLLYVKLNIIMMNIKLIGYIFKILDL